jgi:hypothetical protein
MRRGHEEGAVAGHQVILMVRADCHACDRAADDVRRVCAELDVPWTTEDVDADPDKCAEYGDRVPVILIDGVEHGYWKVEETRFRTALSA